MWNTLSVSDSTAGSLIPKLKLFDLSYEIWQAFGNPNTSVLNTQSNFGIEYVRSSYLIFHRKFGKHLDPAFKIIICQNHFRWELPPRKISEHFTLTGALKCIEVTTRKYFIWIIMNFLSFKGIFDDVKKLGQK